MSKNYFNDPSRYGVTYRVQCASCRCETIIKVNQYPHGPHTITACPICYTIDKTNLQIKEI